MRFLQGWDEWRQDQEELKEIAHLYFSEKRHGEVQDATHTTDPAIVIPKAHVMPVLVPSSGEQEHSRLSMFVLLNVALILHIWRVPIVLVGSRARLKGTISRRVVGSLYASLDTSMEEQMETFYGPMGILIHRVNGPPYDKSVPPEPSHVCQAGLPRSSTSNGSGFVFTDHKDWFFQNSTSSSLVIFPLQPQSNEVLFHEISSLEKQRPQRPGAHWGIIACGFSVQGEAQNFFKEWAKRIEEVFHRPVLYCGFLPGDFSREIDSPIHSPYVLCEPLTYLTQCVRAIASVLSREKDRILTTLPSVTSPVFPHGDRTLTI